MRVSVTKSNKFSYALIENIYSDDQLKYIWKEAEFLCDKRKLQSPKDTGQTGVKPDGTKMKSNGGIFLEDFYRNSNNSNYMNCFKEFIRSNTLNYLMDQDYSFRVFSNLDECGNLFNYYEDKDYYLPHRDKSIMTCVFWFFKEPKMFVGGDLFFPEIDKTIEIKNNSMIIFPSYAFHEVTEITMNDNAEPNNCNGRFSISSFMIATATKQD